MHVGVIFSEHNNDGYHVKSWGYKFYLFSLTDSVLSCGPQTIIRFNVCGNL